MRTWCVDFENEELGIFVDAKTKKQVLEIERNDGLTNADIKQ